MLKMIIIKIQAFIIVTVGTMFLIKYLKLDKKLSKKKKTTEQNQKDLTKYFALGILLVVLGLLLLLL
jgi:low temperature requirement protein LtrA